MLLKAGVDISRLNRDIRRALQILETTYQEIAGDEPVITSTYEGTHMPSSLHYANDAIDVRLPWEKIQEVVEDLKLRLGKDYDIILRPTHIHIEWDPKK